MTVYFLAQPRPNDKSHIYTLNKGLFLLRPSLQALLFAKTVSVQENDS